MELSVVVPTLNAEAALSDCLDTLAEAAPDAERIVADGPSADGTSGMVIRRDDVSVLIELADRSVNAARNAGIAAATGDVIAIVDGFTVIRSGWRDALEDAFDNGAKVVTGPVGRQGSQGDATNGPERRRVGGRQVTYFDGGNVAFDAGLLRRLDGFDEYLTVGGSRDLAHRVAGTGARADWTGAMGGERSPDADRATDFGLKYRSLAYRLAKNYGPRPGVVLRTARRALGDARTELRAVGAGERPASQWLAQGRDVVFNAVRGTADGWAARRADPSPARNPNGVSAREDRAVHVHDWR